MFERQLKWTALDAVLAAAAAAAIIYLSYKAVGASLRPGYDLRFFWVAGQLWIRGVNPYTDDYAAYAALLVKSGFVPDFWPYPPTMFLLCAPLGLISLNGAAAFVAWSNVALVVGASVLLADIHRRDEDPGSGRRWLFLHVFAITALEASALTIVIGQMSIAAYFGATLAWWGIAKGRWLAGGAGLALLMLKPQIGLLIAPLLLFAGPVARRSVIAGAVLSFAIALPAFVIAPTAPMDWLVQVRAYDDVQHANGPTAMTGVRVILYSISGVDIGNLAAMAIACAVAYSAGLAVLRRTRAGNVSALFQYGALAAAATAPLHIYDFMILGLAFDRLARLPWPALGLAAVGAALVWRSENVALFAGLHSAEAEVFPGSLLATIGTTLLAASVLLNALLTRIASNTVQTANRRKQQVGGAPPTA